VTTYLERAGEADAHTQSNTHKHNRHTIVIFSKAIIYFEYNQAIEDFFIDNVEPVNFTLFKKHNNNNRVDWG
jgi:hypothetical protein